MADIDFLAPKREVFKGLRYGFPEPFEAFPPAVSRGAPAQERGPSGTASDRAWGPFRSLSWRCGQSLVGSGRSGAGPGSGTGSGPGGVGAGKGFGDGGPGGRGWVGSGEVGSGPGWGGNGSGSWIGGMVMELPLSHWADVP
ncbi:hypothetical protein GCM10007170_05310 [Arthrobacter liuii]|uniref:Uncharacterized protein n=1 Tax=Arthrobacter liuii TaxID=1476996 RepID=A0ABQ2AHF0_9MICC|nr:hypothetical protein GCM10007170_05310 [Arthrobacter liuii]